MVINFSENVLSALRKRQSTYIQRVCSGVFDSLEEYKFIAGKLKGLEEAEKVVKQTYKEMFHMEDVIGKKGKEIEE